jgi:hypothetical protein
MLARIASAVRADAERRSLSAFGASGVRQRWAFAGTVLVLGLLTTGGARALWSRYVRPPVPVPPSVTPARTRTTSPHAPRARPIAAAPAVEAPPEEPPQAAAPAPPPGPAVVPARAERAAKSAPPSEAALLAHALSELRQRKNPGAALAMLDQHDRQFPRGLLRAEALRARAEALIASNDLEGALALLDSQGPLADLPGADLLLARAELRASKGRYQEAVADFGALLERADHPLPDGDERALYGRAVCLGHLGQDARARADLRDYQRRFPRGRFAGEVDRLLAGAAPRPGRP